MHLCILHSSIKYNQLIYSVVHELYFAILTKLLHLINNTINDSRFRIWHHMASHGE